MSERTSHTAFFGDAEHVFNLTPMLTELERVSGLSIGSVWRKLSTWDWSAELVFQVVRLALIGAGTEPQEAVALVNAYARTRPLLPSVALAIAIVNAAFNGSEDTDDELAHAMATEAQEMTAMLDAGASEGLQ